MISNADRSEHHHQVKSVQVVDLDSESGLTETQKAMRKIKANMSVLESTNASNKSPLKARRLSNKGNSSRAVTPQRQSQNKNEVGKWTPGNHDQSNTLRQLAERLIDFIVEEPALVATINRVCNEPLRKLEFKLNKSIQLSDNQMRSDL